MSHTTPKRSPRIAAAQDASRNHDAACACARCDKCRAEAVASGACELCSPGKAYHRCEAHGAAAGVARSLHSHRALFHSGVAS